MTVYINGVLQPQPKQWVAFTFYGDTSNPTRFVVIADNGMVLSN
jgi:hypothetical protein